MSQKEKEEHEITHTPFRPRCKYCVRGRAKSTGHQRSKEGEDEQMKVPRISLDYFFLSKEDQKAHRNPLIGMVDEETGEKYARAVGHKGLGEEHEVDWLIKDISEELKAWGHAGGEKGQIILKCDGERAIAAVRAAVSKFHGGREKSRKDRPKEKVNPTEWLKRPSRPQGKL